MDTRREFYSENCYYFENRSFKEEEYIALILNRGKNKKNFACFKKTILCLYVQ